VEKGRTDERLFLGEDSAKEENVVLEKKTGFPVAKESNVSRRAVDVWGCLFLFQTCSAIQFSTKGGGKRQNLAEGDSPEKGGQGGVN